MEKQITYDDVYDAVQQAAERCGITYDLTAFRGKSQTYPLVSVRNSVAFILRSMNWPLCAVGKILGRDHSTIIYYCRTYPAKVETDPMVSAIYTNSCEILGIPLTLKTCTRVNSPAIYTKNKPRKKPVDEGSYITPVNYTAQERKKMKRALRCKY
jgi:hypothetical protein